METLDATRDRLKVRQEPTEPTVVDIWHVTRLSGLANGVLRLLLCPNEENRSSAPRGLGCEIERVLQQDFGLEQVDDVNALHLAVDKAAHSRIPATRLMTEMNSGLEQLADPYTGSSQIILPW